MLLRNGYGERFHALALSLSLSTFFLSLMDQLFFLTLTGLNDSEGEEERRVEDSYFTQCCHSWNVTFGYLGLAEVKYH